MASIKITPKVTMKLKSNTTTSTTEKPKVDFISNLSLPTEKSIPVTDISKFSIFIYGKQGIGKTSFTAKFPEALHLMFEPGAKTEEIFQMKMESWKDVETVLRLLKKETRFKYIIIDTTDLMWDMCASEVCKIKGVDYLKDIGFGDGYNMAGTKFRDALIEFHSKRGLIMLAHDKEKMQLDDSAPKEIIPSTAKRGSETIAKWVDLCAHYYLDRTGNRKLRVRTSTDREAKNRIKHMFKYTDGTLVHDVPMGKSEDEAYKNFILAFENKLENPLAGLAKNKPKSKFTITKK